MYRYRKRNERSRTFVIICHFFLYFAILFTTGRLYKNYYDKKQLDPIFIFYSRCRRTLLLELRLVVVY